MKEWMKEALSLILRDETSWEKDGTLRYRHVTESLSNYRSALFYDEVLVPLYNHATSLLRAVTSEDERDAHFVWEPNLWSQGVGGWMMTECNEQCHMSDIAEGLGNLVDYRTMMIWENDDKWEYDKPTEQEILALGITTTHQMKMF